MILTTASCEIFHLNNTNKYRSHQKMEIEHGQKKPTLSISFIHASVSATACAYLSGLAAIMWAGKLGQDNSYSSSELPAGPSPTRLKSEGGSAATGGQQRRSRRRRSKILAGMEGKPTSPATPPLVSFIAVRGRRGFTQPSAVGLEPCEIRSRFRSVVEVGVRGRRGFTQPSGLGFSPIEG